MKARPLYNYLLLCLLTFAMALAVSCGDDEEPDNPEPDPNDSTEVVQPLVHVLPDLDSAKTMIMDSWSLVSSGKESSLSPVSNQTLLCFSDLQYSYSFENVMNNHNTYKLWEMTDGILLEMNEGVYGTTDYDLLHLTETHLKIRERERPSSFVYFFEKSTLDCN